MSRILVLGAGGFIGYHMVQRLRQEEGTFVHGVDQKDPQYGDHNCHIWSLADLRNEAVVGRLMAGGYDEVYQFAADMGGAGFVFTGEHDLDILLNSARINLNVAKYAYRCDKVFFSSSACIYPAHLGANCQEDLAFPALPDSEYGWEKLFAERVYQTYNRLSALPKKVYIARFHNIYGPQGTFKGGREKAPAALCRKVAQAPDKGSIKIWGSGEQKRSFLYIEDCLDGILALVRGKESGEFFGPVNIGSEEMVSINQLAQTVIDISGKKLSIEHEEGPLGVAERNSVNQLSKAMLDWEPKIKLKEGIERTYRWIDGMVNQGYGL